MSDTEYRVLARKYRPTRFSALIGHETLVKTLTNAFQSGRIAHAFMLTGVRGVGKTTTARLIARALNCIGPDGAGKPSMSPCGVCDPCRAIAEDRHPDVIEMDAASHTGVDEMRELIETVRYRPVSARYKIYIIDEVHMLSKGAFNALLKTLEEPPPDIKFVFATTEINKVPVTVLSRCQRYTLPRIPAETLASYFGEIAGKEEIEIDPGALALIARAADGSVRDGLSILDQAIALSMGVRISEAALRDMLGVADRGLTFDLFEALMAGDAAAALAQLDSLYNGGTDPAMVLQDLLDVTHFVTRIKLEKPGDAAANAAPLADGQDRGRAQGFAGRLGMAALARTWQMLLKGLAEVQHAPQPLKAAEMALIRLVYVSDLPPPGEILKALQAGGGATAQARSNPGSNGSGPRGQSAPRPVALTGGAARAVSVPAAAPESDPDRPMPANFAELVALVTAHREGILASQLAGHLHLVRYEPGLIEFRPAADAPRDLAHRLSQFLLAATGARWMISISSEPGQPTIRQQEQEEERARLAAIEAHPLVRKALDLFRGARIERIIDLEIAAEPTYLNPIAPDQDDMSPSLYEDDDPGPFVTGQDWTLDDERGEDP
jgi:DNA polymerase-3 subunit gamma/tau